jgi:hypothetical protein
MGAWSTLLQAKCRDIPAMAASGRSGRAALRDNG